MGIGKEILKVSGGDKAVDWEKHFGMGVYGAFLSVAAGILILIFPFLIVWIVGLYLIFRGIFEVLRYSKRKVVSAVKNIT